ncbi:hypothetical protein B0H12DRAFT_1073205 [Mycena haematopus]|nr:hypothetical protein B0H12DRAFT_1073205 [Mycena haematopus]
MLQNWRNKSAVVVAGVDDDREGPFVVLDSDKALPATPGIRLIPPSIAQLAFPSPDESYSPSDSSNASHEPFDLARYNAEEIPAVQLSVLLCPENPSPEANFPYAFHRYRPTPSSRTLSNEPPTPPRKLTKRRPSIPEPPPTAAADLSMARAPEKPPLQRRNTFNFNSLRRKKTSSKFTQSEDGHTTLPALPPPSPLTLNIPTYRPFHARNRDSWHLPASPIDLRHSSPPAPGDLISEVAWTGASKAFNTIVRTRGGWRSTWSLSLRQEEGVPPRTRQHTHSRPEFTLAVEEEEVDSPGDSPTTATMRPSLLRRNAAVASPKRRWTLAMALADEGISDELLVEKLEALRSRSRAASLVDSDANDDMAEWDGMWAAYDDELEPPPVPPKDATLGHAQRAASMPALLSPSTATWQSARRALLTCRELVRTERHYLASLHLLLSGGTRLPPPPLMRAYAEALARESTGLLKRMEEDPSAWGVAAAFVGAEDGVEAALVAWCGVVGGWFVDGDNGRRARRLSKMRAGIVHGRSSEGGSRSMLSLNDDAETPGTGKPPTKRRGSLRLLSLGSGLSLSSEPSSPVSMTFRGHSKKERDTRPTVRDLAILPTQRVMRYVLLYRDLLDHTPASSPSRALVARAVDAAMRIAQRCDRAQGNAAFLQQRR